MTDRFLYYPFRFGTRGGVRVTDDADRHLRDKVEASLFTAPGERVNEPHFGVGLNRAVFEPMDELTLAALEFRITQGLARDLGPEVILDRVELVRDDASGTLSLQLGFSRRSDRRPRNLEVRL